jgi:hypothetical protein
VVLPVAFSDRGYNMDPEGEFPHSPSQKSAQADVNLQEKNEEGVVRKKKKKE